MLILQGFCFIKMDINLNNHIFLIEHFVTIYKEKTNFICKKRSILYNVIFIYTENTKFSSIFKNLYLFVIKFDLGGILKLLKLL